MPNWKSLIDAMSGDIRRLDYVDRFSTIPVTLRESVSCHSYWVAIYSVMIHEALSGDPTLLGPIAVAALIHDSIESQTGDYVRTHKYSSEKLKNAIDESEQKVLNEMPASIASLFSILAPMEQRSYVKACIKLADFISLFEYLNREVNRGNNEITSFVLRMKMDMKMMAEKAGTSDDLRIRSMGEMYQLMSDLSYAPRIARCDGDKPVMSFFGEDLDE